MASKQSNDQKPVANGQQHHEASGHFEDSSRDNSSPDGSQHSNSASSVESPDSDVQNVRLAAVAAEYGYQVIKENGQRKFYAPAEWNLPTPPRGSEVFIGKLPRDIYEDELFPLFARCGRIYEMRLMMDFSGTNRGYAFVTFTNAESARRACLELNNYEIRRGRHIGVVLSVDNCRLFVGGIPRTRTGEEVKAEMSKLTDGVVNVILYPSAADKTKNRGFAFVEYESHRAAAKARRKLLPNRIQLWGSVIAVDWAEPEQEVDDSIMANVKVLYVRNLMVHTTEDTLRQAFEQAAGTAGCIERVKKMRDFAFIHFSTRDQALRARDQMNGATLDSAVIEVVLSKPPYQSNIVRCMKNLQKSGGGRAQSVTSNGTEEYIATAVRQMYAATNPALVNTILASPTNSLTSPTTPINPMAMQPTHPVYLSQTAAAFTGFPCIDLSSTTPNMLERQNSMGGQGNGAAKYIGNAVQANNNAGRANRGAAGMRSAGFQAMINNTLRHSATSRRKASEQFLYEYLLNQQQQIPMPVQQQPLGNPQQPMSSPPGLFIIPNAPMWRPTVTAPAGSYLSFVQPSPPFTVPISSAVPTSAPAPMPVVSDSVPVTVSGAIPVSAPTAITTSANSTDESSQLAATQQVQQPQIGQTTPILPSPVLCIGSNGPVSFPGFQQLLSDFCRDHGLVIPQYERLDMHQKDSVGRDVTMFSFKICIPPLINTQGSCSINEMEARETAAQAALSQLTMTMNPMMSPGFDMFGYPMTQASPFIFPEMNPFFAVNPLFQQHMRRPINQQLSVNAATTSPPTAV